MDHVASSDWQPFIQEVSVESWISNLVLAEQKVNKCIVTKWFEKGDKDFRGWTYEGHQAGSAIESLQVCLRLKSCT